MKNFNSEINKLSIFSRAENSINIEEDIQLNLFPYSPSWGEINYKAFGVVSEEFHNELFGLLHNKAGETQKTYDGGSKKVGRSIASFDDWLSEQACITLVDEKHQNKNPRDHRIDKSMSAYIRNYIDHPGDDNTLPTGSSRTKPNIDEIRESINSMIKIYNDYYL
ncbi:TPA: hypothetical protein U0576_002116 [Streptococcus suis]|nr:hypothetical protein [Streptococcus suis]